MSGLIPIHPSNVLALQIGPNTYTYTLASRLGHILQLAEKQFGERDMGFSIVGIEFVPGDVPQVWYPGSCGNIVIQLTAQAMVDNNRACYQLAHETIHLLSPNGGGATNNFEEALATWFSWWYMATHMGQPNWFSNVPSYQLALAKLQPHLERHPDALKNLRKRQAKMFEFQPSDLRSAFPEITDEEALFLCEKFVRT